MTSYKGRPVLSSSNVARVFEVNRKGRLSFVCLPWEDRAEEAAIPDVVRISRVWEKARVPL